MQAQAQRSASKLVKLALTAAVLGAVIACPPSPQSFEPGNGEFSGEGPRYEAAPRPSGVPEGESAPPDVGTTAPDLGEGPLFESAPRPSDVPEGEFRPPDVGSTGSEPYDCNRTGLHLAQVDLASIKAFMDDAYLAFVENERSGNFSLAQERHVAYVTAKTDLDLKRWRCFNCPGEIGCN